jgi:hypothetical protein
VGDGGNFQRYIDLSFMHASILPYLSVIIFCVSVPDFSFFFYVKWLTSN